MLIHDWSEVLDEMWSSLSAMEQAALSLEQEASSTPNISVGPKRLKRYGFESKAEYELCLALAKQSAKTWCACVAGVEHVADLSFPQKEHSTLANMECNPKPEKKKTTTASEATY